MSAFPAIKPYLSTDLVATPRTMPRALPAPRELPKVRARSKPATRSNVLPAIASASVKMACVAAFTYLSVSLAGQVMVEQGRREGIRASARAREAHRVEAILKRDLASLTSARAISDWAAANQFAIPVPGSKPSDAAASSVSEQHANAD